MTELISTPKPSAEEIKTAAQVLLRAAFDQIPTEVLIAGIEEIVFRETGHQVLRNGHDGSFTDAAGELVELLEAGGWTATNEELQC